MKKAKRQYVDNQIQWLRLYQEAEIRAVREAVNKVEATNMQAVDKVEATNRQKFEAQNEWRQQSKDQTSAFLTRREFWGGILAVAVALVVLYFKKA